MVDAMRKDGVLLEPEAVQSIGCYAPRTLAILVCTIAVASLCSIAVASLCSRLESISTQTPGSPDGSYEAVKAFRICKDG